jgi:CDGSH-type Zn-finger protein
VTAAGGAVDAVLCPGGPLLLRGAGRVTDADGTVHQVDRPVVALCRCELSAALPWCDGTHKRLPDDRRPR